MRPAGGGWPLSGRRLGLGHRAHIGRQATSPASVGLSPACDRLAKGGATPPPSPIDRMAGSLSKGRSGIRHQRDWSAAHHDRQLPGGNGNSGDEKIRHPFPSGADQDRTSAGCPGVIAREAETRDDCRRSRTHEAPENLTP